MSDHSRTHPEHLDETAGKMHQAAGEVEAASAPFDQHIAGANYGGGSTANLIHGVVTGVGNAVGGGPEGAGGRVAQHKHEYAGNISKHAANSRQNEAEIAADLDARAQALGAGRTTTAPRAGGGGGTPESAGGAAGRGSSIGQALSPGTSANAASLLHHPNGVPAAGPGTKLLGNLRESDVTRGPDGLITHVSGKPVDDYLNQLGAERAGVYRSAKEDGSFPRKQQGNVIAVGLDHRTGAVYEGINGKADDVVAPGDLHPTLAANLQALRAGGPYPQRDEVATHSHPHPDDPLGHAEVKATNQALWDRQHAGLPTDSSVLGEFTMSPQFQFLGGGGPAPFCANCHGVLSGVHSATGRFTGYPPDDTNLIAG